MKAKSVMGELLGIFTAKCIGDQESWLSSASINTMASLEDDQS